MRRGMMRVKGSGYAEGGCIRVICWKGNIYAGKVIGMDFVFSLVGIAISICWLMRGLSVFSMGLDVNLCICL
jgi:hypothetical protein